MELLKTVEKVPLRHVRPEQSFPSLSQLASPSLRHRAAVQRVSHPRSRRTRSTCLPRLLRVLSLLLVSASPLTPPLLLYFAISCFLTLAKAAGSCSPFTWSSTHSRVDSAPTPCAPVCRAGRIAGEARYKIKVKGLSPEATQNLRHSGARGQARAPLTVGPVTT